METNLIAIESEKRRRSSAGVYDNSTISSRAVLSSLATVLLCLTSLWQNLLLSSLVADYRIRFAISQPGPQSSVFLSSRPRLPLGYVMIPMSAAKRGSVTLFASPVGIHRKSFVGPQPEEEEATGQPLGVLVGILRKPPNQRNLKNLQSLLDFTRGIKFFKQVAAEVSEEAVTQCCIYMTYEHYPKGEYVMRQGEKGTKFYVLLEGACTVLVNVWTGSVRTPAIPVAYYYRGDSFGELALLHNKPRAASIYCTQDSHFAVLEKEDYARILAKVHEIAINKKVDFLHSLPMFCCIARGSVQKWIYYFKERTVQRNQVLYRAGDSADFVYFIRQGEVQILQDVKVRSVTSNACIPKYQVTKTQVAILGTGECVGCEEVLTTGFYQYTSVCHSLSAQLLFVTKDDFTKRVNTDETLKAIHELVKVKEELRKSQVIGGKRIRESERYKQTSGVSKGGSPRAHEHDHPVEKPSILSDPAGAQTPRNIHTASPSYAHLYPFQDKIREGGFRISPKSPIGRESTSSLRRIKSWDRIITIKTRSDSRRKSSPKLQKIVNIHTYNQRKQVLTDRPQKSISNLSMQKSTRRSLYSDESRYQGCLTINSVEVVLRDSEEDEDSRVGTARYERLVATSHSQFRMQRVTPNSFQ